MHETFGSAVIVERDGAIARLTLDRGDGLNALSRDVLNGIRDAAVRLRADTTVHCVIISGRGAFSAGADLKDVALAERASVGLLERREILRAGPDACDALEALDQVTIVAVEKFCIGGAVSLAAACDFRVAASDAHFRLPEVPLGMNMSWHTVPRLVNLMGLTHTKRFVILGERLSAGDAKEQGLIDTLAAPGEALSTALALAQKVAALPPIAVRMTKRAITAVATALNPVATFMDGDQFALAATSDDHKEAVAAFLEKRKPRFTGR